MAKAEKINNFLKHKRIIFCSLIFIGLIVMIFLIYILTYANNKPKPFKDDENVKITNKCDYFTFKCVAKTMDINNKSNPTMEIDSEISNITTTVKNVHVYYEVHNNWTSAGYYKDSNGKEIESGNALTPTTTKTYIETTTLSLPTAYPIKALPLVRVKHPILYAKITFDRKLPDSSNGQTAYRTETVYYKITYSTYVDNTTVFK